MRCKDEDNYHLLRLDENNHGEKEHAFEWQTVEVFDARIIFISISNPFDFVLTFPSS